MWQTVSYLVVGVSLVLAGWALVLVALNRPAGPGLLVGVGVLELVLVLAAVVALASAFGSDHEVEQATVVGYALGMVVIPPIATLWSLEEKTRSGTAVLAVAFVAVAVMAMRVTQLLAGPTG